MENNNRFLFFDTETNDLSPNQVALQLAWILTDGDGRELIRNSYYLKRDVYISPGAYRAHQISKTDLMEKGTDPTDVYRSFLSDVKKCTHMVAHNAKFDIETVQNDLSLLDVDYDLSDKVLICTMKDTKNIVKATDKNGRLKNPRLEEFAGLILHGNKEHQFSGLHDAMEDTRLLKESFFRLKEIAESIYCEVDTTPAYQQLTKQQKRNESPKKRPVMEITDMPVFLTSDELADYDTATIFRDKKVLVTGVLSDIGILDRAAASAIIDKLGGIVQKSIVKDIDFVVIGDDCGPKKMQILCDMQAKGCKVKCIDKQGMKLICSKQQKDVLINKEHIAADKVHPVEKAEKAISDNPVYEQEKLNKPNDKEPVLQTAAMPVFLTEEELRTYDMKQIFRGCKVIIAGVLCGIGVLDRVFAIAIIEKQGGVVQKTIVTDIDFAIIGDDCDPKKLQTLCDMQANGHKVKCIDNHGFKIICNEQRKDVLIKEEPVTANKVHPVEKAEKAISDNPVNEQEKLNTLNDKEPVLQTAAMPVFLTEEELRTYDMKQIFRGCKVIIAGVLCGIGVLDRVFAIAIIEKQGGVVQKTIVTDIDFAIIGDDCDPKKLQTLCDMQANGHKVKCIDNHGFKIICNEQRKDVLMKEEAVMTKKVHPVKKVKKSSCENPVKNIENKNATSRCMSIALAISIVALISIVIFIMSMIFG